MAFAAAANAGVNVGSSIVGPLLQARDPLRRIQVRSLEQSIENQKQDLEFSNKIIGLLEEGKSQAKSTGRPSPLLTGLEELVARDPSRKPGFTGPPTPFNQITDEQIQAGQAGLDGASGNGFNDTSLPPDIAAVRSNVLQQKAVIELQKNQLEFVQDNAIDLLADRLGVDFVKELDSQGKEQMAFRLLQTDSKFRDLVRSRTSRNRSVLGLQTLGVSDVFRGVRDFFSSPPSFEDLFGRLAGEAAPAQALGSPLDAFTPEGPELFRDASPRANARRGLLPNGNPIL